MASSLLTVFSLADTMPIAINFSISGIRFRCHPYFYTAKGKIPQTFLEAGPKCA